MKEDLMHFMLQKYGYYQPQTILATNYTFKAGFIGNDDAMSLIGENDTIFSFKKSKMRWMFTRAQSQSLQAGHWVPLTMCDPWMTCQIYSRLSVMKT